MPVASFGSASELGAGFVGVELGLGGPDASAMASRVPIAPPITWAAMNAGTDAGAIPA